MTKNTYSNEFKHESALLVIEQSYGITEACKVLNVSKSALTNWVKQVLLERQGGNSKSTALSPEQLKIRELEKRLKRMELENSILKKASALLMSDFLNTIS